VAVVTSLSGAVVRDICVTLQRDACPPEITLVSALVQGDGAVESLVRALELAAASGAADLIVVGRGGGSLEDLWAFNTEPVARAIAASPIPVISAVGHETDFTLADMVADWRAPTPTAAAERIASDRAAFLRRLEAAEQALGDCLRSQLYEARMRLAMTAARAPLAHPLWLIDTRRQRLDDLEGRLARVGEYALERGRHRLALAAERLRGVDPLATLARGYSVMTRSSDGTPVRTTRDAQVGEQVRIQLRDGTLLATVTEVDGPGTQTAKELAEP
jgi:exodeoxyribonuclease VII large subunit